MALGFDGERKALVKLVTAMAQATANTVSSGWYMRAARDIAAVRTPLQFQRVYRVWRDRTNLFSAEGMGMRATYVYSDLRRLTDNAQAVVDAMRKTGARLGIEL